MDREKIRTAIIKLVMFAESQEGDVDKMIEEADEAVENLNEEDLATANFITDQVIAIAEGLRD